MEQLTEREKDIVCAIRFYDYRWPEAAEKDRLNYCGVIISKAEFNSYLRG